MFFLPVNKLSGATFLKMISTEFFFENVERFLRQQHALLISASVTRWLVKIAQFLGKKVAEIVAKTKKPNSISKPKTFTPK
jgi:hypothetical protein